MENAFKNILTDKHVLIVEDDALVGIGLLTCLEEIGAKVSWTSDVGSAITAIESTNLINLAIVDINLNGVRSDPVLDELIARDIPILLCTGYDSSFIGDRYRTMLCVAKPFTRNKVIPIVSELISIDPDSVISVNGAISQ
jgi:DNA-binding response OmpR family regulator